MAALPGHGAPPGGILTSAFSHGFGWPVTHCGQVPQNTETGDHMVAWLDIGHPVADRLTMPADSWPSTTGVGMGTSPRYNAGRCGTARKGGAQQHLSALRLGRPTLFDRQRLVRSVRGQQLSSEYHSWKFRRRPGSGQSIAASWLDAGEGDVGGLHVVPAKADIGRIDVGHLDLPHDPAVGSDDRDVARDQNVATANVPKPRRRGCRNA